MPSPPKKLAVLGGGLGSLATVFELTSDPQWNAAHEVTVYQMGWRLGGKGASGRNLDLGCRNEEHGVHMWMGFYTQAFRMIEACYAEMNPAPDNPLSTIDKAFVGKRKATFTEKGGALPSDWVIEFPLMPGRPADAPENLNVWDLILVGLAWLLQLLRQETRWLRWLRWAGRIWKLKASDHFLANLNLGPLEDLIEAVERFAKGEAVADLERVLNVLEVMARTRYGVADLLFGESSERARKARRLSYLVQIAAAVVRGVIEDRVFREGYQAIDDQDFVEWLIRHGASRDAARCAPIVGFYDAMFAYQDGDPNQPRAAAGTVLHSALKTFFGYRGALYYQMQAGMGDVVFAPIYKVLKQRGVRFEFFTNVLELELSADKSAIDSIRIGRQVEISAGADGYDPLVPVKGLPCWPDRPKYEELTNPDRAANYELPDMVGTQETLNRGADFDAVLLGIPVGAHPTVCRQLIDHSPAWQNMVTNISTVATLGVQVWFNRTWEQLGGDESIIGSALPSELTIRANSSAIVPLECWPEGDWPKAISYHCSTFQVPSNQRLPVTGLAEWRVLEALVVDRSTSWLNQHASLIWSAADPAGGAGLDWSYVYQFAPEGAMTFAKPNITPSDLYVQSLPGTGTFRLKANQSGVGNLVLTGDWIDNEFINAGFIEGTVVAGLSAAAAVRALD